MRRNYAQYVLLLIVFGWVAFPTGCNKPAIQQPLAPGYQSQADQKIGQTLAGADAFYTSVQCATTGLGYSQSTHACDQSAHVQPYTPSAGEKSKLNDLSLSLNAANQVYLAYHSGTATLEQAQAAINNAVLKQAAAEAVVPQSVGVR